jgi:DNA-directed RNA polymerase specialized sigma24 family protein
MLDIPAATVRTRLSRALARLRAHLELEEEQG